MSWWQTDAERLREAYIEAGESIRALARAMGCDRETAGRWLRRHNILVDNMPQPTMQFGFEGMREYQSDGDWMLTSDWHLPVTNYQMVQRMIRTAEQFGIRKLGIVGDYFNMDALGDYMPKQKNASLPVEVNDGRELMRWVLEQFDEVVLTLGNHDLRFMRTLGYRLKFEHSIKLLLGGIADDLLTKLTVTGRDYMLIDSPTGLWRVAHTNSYSIQPLARPCKLADRFRCNVATGHAHHHAVGTSPSGYYAVELGGMFDENATEYLVRWTNAFPKWKGGYVALVKGIPYLPELAPIPA